jgi:hypothetical protein
MEPAVAWRTVAAPTGGLLVLHQYGLASTIEVSPQPATDDTLGGLAQNSYGEPSTSCSALVQPAVSRVGNEASMGIPISGMGLTVDASISPDGETLALADASADRVSLLKPQDALLSGDDPTGCVPPQQLSGLDGTPIAVAFNPVGNSEASTGHIFLVVQTRQPARVITFGRTPSYVAPESFATLPLQRIDLGGDDVSETGHELFHKLQGAQIACASCHPEAGEDGRVWKFDPTGDRRTQAVYIGLKGTEPFHWDGELTNFHTLVAEIMVHRMGGILQSPEREAAFKHWLFQLSPPAAIVAANDARAVRGHALFQSPEVGCSGCHAGAHLTNNRSVFVGTTEDSKPLQVPSLRGVGYRAPFLHNGCAATLRERFDPKCGGGDLHGRTSGLKTTQIDDLLAYLESL